MSLILEAPRLAAAAGVVAAYLGVCGLVARAQWKRRRADRNAASALASGSSDQAAWLVAHASQTGTAEQLAWHSARLLHAAGLPARVASLAQLKLEDLQRAGRALFIVSTYGEGDPPDSASLFARRVMALAADTARLSGLQCGVLALGDAGYANYCGFGRRLDGWLAERGARPLFDRIEVDQGDASALAAWQRELGRLAGVDAATPAGSLAAPYADWRLCERQHLNPGSAGAPIFRIVLEPVIEQPPPAWQAGDIAQILPPGDDTTPRDYSIASLGDSGRVELLVRQVRHANRALGVASGWLTEGAAPGATLRLRLRSNPNFHIGDNAERPLLLVGNGTGLAGLRAHLAARAASGRAAVRAEREPAPERAASAAAAPCWLVFGERHAAHDAYCRDEIEAWQRAGVIERMDWVFSRDGARHEYVQHRLAAHADLTRQAVQQGAAIYVCGSLAGMAGGVDAALREALGDDAVDALLAAGRYRRDVY